MRYAVERSSIVSTIAAAVLARDGAGAQFIGADQVAQMIASKIAHGRGKPLKICNLPPDAKNGDLAAFLTNIEANDLVFFCGLDGYPAELFKLIRNAVWESTIDITIGEVGTSRSVAMHIQPFVPFMCFSGPTERADAMCDSVPYCVDVRSIRGCEDVNSILESEYLKNILSGDLFDSSAEISDLTYRSSEIFRAQESGYEIDVVREVRELRRRFAYMRSRNRNPILERRFDEADQGLEEILRQVK